MFPKLEIAEVDWFSFAVYPLTGGFKQWSLISPGVATRLLKLERAVERTVGPLAAFRMMLVVEKTA